MLDIYERLGTHCHAKVNATVVLSHEQRERGRLRLQSTEGMEVRLFLERGKPLKVGEYLKSQCGQIVRIEGAVEDVMMAQCTDWPTFARACYHLGNRHVKVQVGELWLRIKPDHVLGDMLAQLGLTVHLQQAVFVPESGAYAKAAVHHHHHDHDHHQGSDHPHDH